MIVALLAGAAHAASCCAVSNAAVPDVLGSCEAAGASLAVAVDHRVGTWYADGTWATGGSFHRDAVTTSVSGLLRLRDSVQASVSVPAHWESTRAGEVREQDLGPGDLRASLRLDGPAATRHGLAAWRPALTLSTVAPTGHGVSPWLFAGDAQWDGLHARGQWVASGGAAVASDGALARASGTVSGTLDLNERVSIVGGVDITGAPTRHAQRVDAAVGFVVYPSRTLRLTTTLRAPVPFFGRNDAGDVGLAVGVFRMWAQD